MSAPTHLVIEMEPSPYETPPSPASEYFSPQGLPPAGVSPGFPAKPPETPGPSPKISPARKPMKYEASLTLPHRELSYYGTKKKELGKGTYGTVSMYDDGPAGKVAIKMLRYNVDDKEGITSTTLREISIMIRMHHPNVVPVLDVFIAPIKPKIYMVMPMASMDLYKYIESRRGTAKANINVAYQIINGVNYCLSKGILNRDIKPQNILVYADGSIKIADFGLARASMCSYDSGTTSVVYTLWYRPPEILLGGSYGDPADIWAVGCTLFQLCTGPFPLFEGYTEMGMLYAIAWEFGKLDDAWPKIVNLPTWKDIPITKRTHKLDTIPDLDMRTIIRGMLAIDPQQRTTLQTVLKNKFFDSVRVPANEDTNTYSCTQILEERSQLPVSGISTQKEITKSMMIIVLDWLSKIDRMFKLKKQSFFLAQILLEKYIAKKQVAKTEIQLYACACSIVAAKVVEIYSPEINDYVHMTENAYTKDQIIKAATDLVDTLGFDLIYSTSADFLIVFMKAGNYIPSVKNLSYSLLRVLTIEPTFYFKYTPEEMALGCLFVACTYTGCTFKHTVLLTPAITKFVKQFTSYKLREGGLKPEAFLTDFQKVKMTPADNFASIQEAVKTKSTTVL